MAPFVEAAPRSVNTQPPAEIEATKSTPASAETTTKEKRGNYAPAKFHSAKKTWCAVKTKREYPPARESDRMQTALAPGSLPTVNERQACNGSAIFEFGKDRKSPG